MLADGLDVWLWSILPTIGFAMVLVIVMAVGLHRRHLWFVRYVFVTGSLLLAGYGLGLLLSLAVLLRLVPTRSADLQFMSVVNIVFWSAQGLFAWLLLRMLRLNYWQPWSKPESWEAGDETPPRWGMSPKPDPNATRRSP